MSKISNICQYLIYYTLIYILYIKFNILYIKQYWRVVSKFFDHDTELETCLISKPSYHLYIKFQAWIHILQVSGPIGLQAQF